MNKKLIAIVMTVFLVLVVTGCKKEEKAIEPISRTEIFMGTAIKVTLYDSNDEEILNKVFDHILEMENLVSINKEGTEVDNLNKNSGIKPVKMSEDSFNIIKAGVYYSKLSDGGYDISIGPLVKLWSIGLPEANVPSEEKIQETISKVDYSKIEINEGTREVFLKDKGMILDLGSIAKGYIADEVVKILKKEKVNKAIIDLGGNIYALGKKDETNDWKVGIQDPKSERGNVIGAIKVSNKTIVTTGTYERFLEKDGAKYHHILNPKTGYPYETNIAGVSIITDKSIHADALSTLIFTKGIEDGLRFIEKLENTDAIFVTKDNKIYLTDGIKDNFELMNEDFEVIK
ncbi:MAG: FAD:protein FMN transferase [Paraclostridium sp.]